MFLFFWRFQTPPQPSPLWEGVVTSYKLDILSIMLPSLVEG